MYTQVYCPCNTVLLDGARRCPNMGTMLNLLSLGLGLVSIVPVLFALLPLLGWANWLILPLPVVGLILGVMSRRSEGRNLNLIVIAIAVVRLMLGGGIF
jgi:hypothetical protein